METHEIEFEIRKDGTVHAQVVGAKGGGCLEYAKLLEQILATTGDVQLTSEYYELPTGVQVNLENKVGK